MLQRKMLSGGLPALARAGNKIFAADSGAPMRLRGVNRSGLEYSFRNAGCCLASAGVSEAELDAIAGWGANIIRLPFNQAWVLGSADLQPQAYLEVLDEVIRMAAERGMYTLLDLQWLEAATPRGTLKDGRPNFVPALPDAGSVQAWRILAARYRHEPAVLFDIFNEPHDPLLDDPTRWQIPDQDRGLRPLRKRRVGAPEWHPWARELIRAIRSEHQAALVFVSGLDWGYDLESFPLNIENVVYSTHVYPSKKKSWEKAFGKLSWTHPVFVAEWGGTDEDLAWGEKLVKYLNELEIGWTAWSWSDHPYLIRANTTFTPTVFGELVRASLT